MLSWILYALVLVSVLTALEALWLLLNGDPTDRRQAVKQRLQRHASRVAEPIDGMGILIEGSDRESWFGRMSSGFARRRDLELLLYRAGMPYTLPQYVALTILLVVVGLAVGLFVTGSLWTGGALMLIGLYPTVSVVLRKRKRMQQFELQLPEALDLICRALRAGISLEFGFRSVGDELEDPIGTEFGQLADEVSLGLDTRVALQNLALRMNTSDMPFFVNAIMIQRETGGNLAEILENLANIVRQRIKFYGKVKALVAQVNLQANMLAVLPLIFALLLGAVSPGYLDPLFVPPGIYFLYGMCVSVPIGWLLCRRIAAVKE